MIIASVLSQFLWLYNSRSLGGSLRCHWAAFQVNRIPGWGAWCGGCRSASRDWHRVIAATVRRAARATGGGFRIEQISDVGAALQHVIQSAALPSCCGGNVRTTEPGSMSWPGASSPQHLGNLARCLCRGPGSLGHASDGGHTLDQKQPGKTAWYRLPCRVLAV